MRPRRPPNSLARLVALLGAITLVRIVAWAAPYQRCDGAWTRIDTVETCGACGVRCGSAHATASCVAGRCVLGCDVNHADCDGHPANGCEVDLRTDRAHCGLCTRSCGGARCEEGRCVARLIGSGAAIAVAEDAVYALGRTVTRYPLDGSDSSIVDLPREARPASTEAPIRLLDGPFVYQVEPLPDGGSAVKRAPRDGGAAVTVVTHPYLIRALAENGSHLFWVDDRQRIFMAVKASSRPGAPW